MVERAGLLSDCELNERFDFCASRNLQNITLKRSVLCSMGLFRVNYFCQRMASLEHVTEILALISHPNQV